MDTETRNCQNCKQDFPIYSDDASFYEQIQVPAPTFCPDCRAQRRFIWRNERALYKRACDLCKKSFICLYAEDAPYIVYCKECWYGDGWDSLSYGVEYDPNRPFFEQFKELMRHVPRLGIWIVQSTNSDYTNLSYANKNGYLSFGFRDSEDVAYVGRAVALRNTLDATYTHHSEGVYQAVNVDKSYRSKYLEESEGIVDSAFMSNSRNSQNCMGGVNLRSMSNVFFGEQLSKSEYEARVKTLDLGSRAVVAELAEKFEEEKIKAIYKYAKLTNCVNSTGDHLINAKNCRQVFDGFELDNARYSAWVFTSKDIADCWGMGGSELVYDSVSPEEVANAKFVHVSDTSNNIEYTDICKSSNNLFGCISVRSKSYCILNRQYSKEEYEALVERIKADMEANPYIDQNGRVFRYGEFFPYDLSPFAYNETTAQEMYPLTKEQALSLGFRWREDAVRNYAVTKKPEDLPDNITDVTDAILKEVIQCSHDGKCTHQCTTAFKITDAELSFYRANSVPLPTECSNCRYYARLTKRNPMKLWHGICMCEMEVHGHAGKCQNEFETSYAPERPETVYCEACYQKEVL